MREKIFRSIFLIILFLAMGFMGGAVDAQVFAPFPAYTEHYEVINPWIGSTYTFDQTQVRDLFAASSVIDVASGTPFSAFTSHTAEKKDLFSTSFVNVTSSSTLWGKSLQSGTAYYSDPWVTTGGEYLDFGLPTMGLSTDSAFYQGITGAGGSVSSALDTTWFHFESSLGTETEVGTVMGPFGPLPAQSFEVDKTYATYGKVDIATLGIHPALAGAVTLRSHAVEIGAMDRVLSENPLYTKDGQKIYATVGYYNPYSESNWFYPTEISASETHIDTVAGRAVSGYAAATSVGRSVVTPGIVAAPYNYIPSGVGSIPVSGRSVVSGVASGAYSPGYAGVPGGGGVIQTPAGVPNFAYGYSGPN
ncbi:MAG: hypothetical protein ACMUJM_06870 [bacterium]